MNALSSTAIAERKRFAANNGLRNRCDASLREQNPPSDPDGVLDDRVSLLCGVRTEKRTCADIIQSRRKRVYGGGGDLRDRSPNPKVNQLPSTRNRKEWKMSNRWLTGTTGQGWVPVDLLGRIFCRDRLRGGG